MVKKYSLCIISGIISTIILCALLALVALKTPEPRDLYSLFGYASYFFGCIICAIFTAKLLYDFPLISCALSGSIFTLIIMTASLLIRDENSMPFIKSLIFYLIGILICALIGLISMKKSSSASRTRKNMIKRMKKR